MDRSGLGWTVMDRGGPRQTGMDRIGSQWTSVDRGGLQLILCLEQYFFGVNFNCLIAGPT